MKKEYILCAAIYFDDNKPHMHQPKNISSGFVVAGRRHHNCISTAALMNWKASLSISPRPKEGFLTSRDNFVTREEAFNIAEMAGQVKEEEAELKSQRILLSEDLY